MPLYGTLIAIVRSENEPSTVCSDRGADPDPLVAVAALDAVGDQLEFSAPPPSS